jgi:hypothetical protein
VYGIDNAVVSAARGLSPVVGGAIVAAVVVGREPVGLDFGVVFLVVAALFALAALLTAWRVPGDASARRAPSAPGASPAVPDGGGPAVSPGDPRPPVSR